MAIISPTKLWGVSNSEILNFDDLSTKRRVWSEHNLEPIRDAFEIWNIYKMDVFQLISVNCIEIILLKPR